VIVEAAIATGAFSLLIFGTLEFGYAFRDYLTTANIVRNGARTASSMGNEPTADYEIVQAVARAAKAVSSGQVNYVVVYDAGTPGAPLASVSSTCAAGTPVTGVCNVYTPADFTRPATDYGCGTAPPAPDRFFCPASRRINASAATGGPPSYIGVYVSLKHDYLTNLFGTTQTYTDQTVLRIEPRQP
jgi:hypothetical protein